MGFQDLIHKVAETGRFGRHTESLIPPMLDEAIRFPYGPFRFKVRLAKGVEYIILASTDLHTWSPLAKWTSDNGTLDYIDSEAFKHSYRFYRVQAGKLASTNVLGYASVTLPPGFSMIANPFDGPDNTISALFKAWPDGTTFNKFDTRFFRLAENAIKFGKWSNTTEKLMPGEGGIFFNPTTDYKSASFVGEVQQGASLHPDSIRVLDSKFDRAATGQSRRSWLSHCQRGCDSLVRPGSAEVFALSV